MTTFESNPVNVYRLWGKTNELHNDNSAWSYHSLACHLVDVGHVLESWLEVRPFQFHQIARALECKADQHLKAALTVTAALHDLGKVDTRFQAKSPKGWEIGYGKSLVRKPLQTDIQGFDHGKATAAFIKGLDSGIPDCWKSAIYAAAGHHGSLYSDTTIFASARRVRGRETAQALAKVIQQVFEMEHWPKINLSGAFRHYLAGLVSVADWLGSDENTFPHTQINSIDSLTEYLNELRSGRIGSLQIEHAGLGGKLIRKHWAYQELFPFIISESDLRPLQSMALKTDFGESDQPEMLIIEAPMGMGKTEIALEAAARSIGMGNSIGLYFALPTQATANAMTDRLQDFMDRIADPASKASFRLAHSAWQFNDTFLRLIEGWSLLTDQQVDRTNIPAGLVAPEWLLSNKRALLATAGVGTIDQAMVSVLKLRHNFVRLFGLGWKVLIIDELHAYDTYMNSILIRMVEYLRELNAKVIILSATLPELTRIRFLKAFKIEGNTGNAYPQIILGKTGSQAQVLTLKLSEPGKSLETEIIAIPNDQRTEQGLQLCRELLLMGGCVAWIRNTVGEAQEAARLFSISEPGTRVILFHSRFCPFDRSRIENELLSGIGKSGHRPEKLLVIATQVAEQSLDVDFDAMITDLAPVDLMLQRAGRLWRHSRPMAMRKRHEKSILRILAPSADEVKVLNFGKSGVVYLPEILLRSLIAIGRNTKWDLTLACRSLVSDVYDKSSEDWMSEYGEIDRAALSNFKKKSETERAMMEQEAVKYLIPPPGNNSAQDFTGNDQETSVMAATRYKIRNGALKLIRENVSGYHFLYGDSPDLVSIKGHFNTKNKLLLEKSAMLSTVQWLDLKGVSFAQIPQDPGLQRFIVRWRNAHPLDKSGFLVLGEDGKFASNELNGTYSATLGLTIT